MPTASKIPVIPLLGAGLVLGISSYLPEGLPSLTVLTIWGTSFPHTFGGFTRRDLLNSRSLLKATLIYGLVLAPILMLRNDLDLKWLFTLYFFWQQFHYARQSYGICKRENRDLNFNGFDSFFYLGTAFIASIGVLSVGPHSFFNYALENPFPFNFSPLFSGLLLGFFGILYLSIRPKQLWLPALIHSGLYLSCFILGKHFLAGWLALNLFHNLQYLNLLHKENRNIMHFVLPLILTLLTFKLTQLFPLTLFLIALNFSHYIWDSQVWRSQPRPSPSP